MINLSLSSSEESLEEEILNNSLVKPLVWWRNIYDIFMMWKHGEEELQNLLETLNCPHRTIKFTQNTPVQK